MVVVGCRSIDYFRCGHPRIRLDMWDSGVSRDEALGSASLNLEMAVENSIQDRWLQLAGEETGELRVRLAAVPGDAER